MKTPEIIRNLEALEKEFSGSSVHSDAKMTIRDWGKELRSKLPLAELKNNAGIQMIMKELSDKIKRCDNTLKEDEALTDEQRKLIFRERRCWRWFMILLDGAEKSIDNIGNNIKEQLKGQ